MNAVKPRELPQDNMAGGIEEINWRARRQTGMAHQPEDTGKQASTLVRQVSRVSTREMDRLIDDLKNLRDKLESDGNRIQSDIVEYASLSQSALQLTKIVTDAVAHVKGISDAASAINEIPSSKTPLAI
ncbi:MAG TPA: hypothetical protein VEI49_05200 [Terriglobales bacterium]|nr:hypothetical protein [Terriglobales bacterium]